MSTRDSPVVNASRRHFDYMVDLRRALHEIPEVGLHLPHTQALVRKQLEGLGLRVESDDASSGLSAIIPGRSADTLVLRADMDALPVDEPVGLEFRSKNVGAMHACGHDLHTAMLLGAARDLVEHQPEHTIVLAFQAGEEFDRGAVPLLAHRNLSSTRSARTFALHTHAVLPSGTLNWRVGPFMGYGDWFAVEIEGRGGHGSNPQRARTPITPAAELAIAINAITDLTAQPWPTLVATVTELLAGNSVNVIPARARLRGTLRATEESAIVELRDRVEELARAVARASQTHVTFALTEGYPAVLNDSEATAHAIAVAVELIGEERVTQMPGTSMVIEDYAYFTRRWPGSMLYLGAQVPEHDAFNHSPDVMFDEDAMVTGCAFFLGLANSA